MLTAADYGLGEYEYPRGWFMIGKSSDVGQTPVTLKYFGREMVIYRGESGTPYLIHAYCPHMGAHFGKNSTSYILQDNEQIQGESIRCPFHGWRFGPDGKCDDIPYSPNFIPKAACVKTYHVVERSGMLWTWNDPEGGEPEYDLPAFAEWDMAEEGWVRWTIDEYPLLNIHPVEIVDNMADFGHMAPIHGSTNCKYFDNTFDDHICLQRFDAGHRTLTAGSDDVLSLDTWYTGPAILQARMFGAFPSLMVLAHTPVDKGTVRLWHALMVKMSDTTPTAEQIEAARLYETTSRDAVGQDVEIWANKEPCINPMQIPADGPYGKVRTWYRQFYNPRDKADGFRQRVNGTVVTFGTKRETARDAA